MRHVNLLVFLILMGTIIITAPAHAVTRVDITKGKIAPLPVAIPAFSGDSAMAREITEVVSADLERSGMFAPIDPRAFIERITSVDAIPRFPDWRQIDAQSLAVGTVSDAGGGNIRAEFRLWDVLSQKQVAGRAYTAPAANWRRVAHLIADEIYSRLTGEGPYFDSRIVYISESGSRKDRVKRLAIMDQDGANHKFLTAGKSMVLTPRFDPSSQRIIYMAYYGGKPSVYLYDLETGREDMLGRFPGISFAPRFSPDGTKAILSVSENGNSDIYVLDLVTRRLQRITADSAIDTSPSYSPDGKRIVFNSDRGGSQQLYVMNADGSGVQRISFGQGNYATPVWSPRGDLIAFTKMSGGNFYIGVMRPDGSGERLLTESFLVEGPTWSPNGRVIMYTRGTPSRSGADGDSALYSVDITGYNERRADTPGEGSDPAWSPLLGK